MHVIRLRKPWTRIESDGRASQIDVPEPSSSIGGLIRYRRAFNCPTGLDSKTKVHLNIDHWCGEIVSITLNDHNVVPNDQQMPMNFDITDWLVSGNRLTIEINPLGNGTASLSGEVTLQIETD